MISYLLRRILVSLLVLIGISIVIFVMLHLISDSPGRVVLGPQASAAAVEAFNRENGYDRPLFVQYADYVVQLLHGDLGRSYKLNEEIGRAHV